MKRGIIIGILTGTVIALIIYILKFNCDCFPCLSSEPDDWGSFGSYFSGTIGSLSFLIALYALYRTIEKEKFNVLYSFLKDYRSKEMSDYIIDLWAFYKEDKETLRDRYKIEHENKSDIYLARRNVSQFYLQLSICIKNDEIKKKLAFSIWNCKTLTIIDDIIIPCEKANPDNDNPDLGPYEYLRDECKNY